MRTRQSVSHENLLFRHSMRSAGRGAGGTKCKNESSFSKSCNNKSRSITTMAEPVRGLHLANISNRQTNHFFQVLRGQLILAFLEPILHGLEKRFDWCKMGRIRRSANLNVRRIQKGLRNLLKVDRVHENK
jgi:hypothetical protein